MKRMSVIGDGGRVDIDVLTYERPDTNDGSDANWLSCAVSVQIGPFSGRYDASFSTQDFAYFAEGLEQLQGGVVGEAVFDPEEGAIALKMLGNGSGQVIVEVRSVIVAAYRVLVDSKMPSDQSYIPELLHSVRAILREFPERGRASVME